MRRNLCNSSRHSAGQILPLLAVVLTALFSIGMALSNAVLSTHRNFMKGEVEFQERFKESMRIANQLNVLAENNRRIEKILSALLDFFKAGTGQALDLAASTPLWERKLPIPQPESVYDAFSVAILNSTNLLYALSNENTELIRTFPANVKSAIHQLSPLQSICLISEKDTLHSERNGSDLSCSIYINQSFLAVPLLRRVSDLRILNEKMGAKGGLTEVRIYDELTLSIQKSPYLPDTTKNSPVLKKFILTHPRFCISHVEISLRSLCPEASSTARHTSHAKQKRIEFDPGWSIRVEDTHD